jgi:ribonuclease Z
MRTIFHPYLCNGLSGDPGLWIDLIDEGRSVLLDLGDLRPVPSRKLLRVERVVVTHTHMDHFIGFDHLLRLVLGREKELVVSGPTGFLTSVEGKLSAYTWNLIEEYPVRLVVEEVDGDTVRSMLYTGAARMRPQPQPARPFDGTLHAERLYTIHVETLDHGVPVLGVALRETEHISVNKDRLVRLGLRPGPWLRDLKQAARRCQSGDAEILAQTADGTFQAFRRGELIDEILIRSPGQRIAYVTDLRYTPDNVEKVLQLARDVDLLVCEAAFLHEDEPLARERHHLTARQAGEIARAAGARRLAPFHFSPRYQGRERELLAEAADAFGDRVLSLIRGAL